MPMPIWTQIQIWNLTYSPPPLCIGTHGEGCLLYPFCIFIWRLHGLFGCYWRTVWRSWILYMALALHFLLLIVFHLFLSLVPLFVHRLIPKQWWSRTTRWATKHTEKAGAAVALGRKVPLVTQRVGFQSHYNKFLEPHPSPYYIQWGAKPLQCFKHFK